MDTRINQIRENEKMSHTKMYTDEKLYHTDSWLQKPVKTVREISSLFDNYTSLRVLDLGCGVGRNSIYIAKRFQGINCSVDCVDLLPLAIEKLSQNAKEHNVSLNICGINKSIENYEIFQNHYDLIMAISALEHVDSPDSFFAKLIEIKNGLRENGIVCLVINSNIEEVNADTNEIIEAQFETNFTSENLQKILEEVFNGWEVLKNSVVRQEYDIPRESFISHLHTDVVTYVARYSLST